MGEVPLQLDDRLVESSVGAFCQLHLSKVRRHGIWVALHCTQQSERIDVARAYPDRIERRFAIQAGEDRLLNIAVTAMALERFGDDRDRPFAGPEFRDREPDAPK